MAQDCIIEGRIVWGHPAKPQGKTDDYNKPVLNDQGQQIQQYVFGLAVEKAKFDATAWPLMWQEMATHFPAGEPPKFSWKLKDGDVDVDKKGKPYRDYEGRAGCRILTISTEGFQPNIYKMENGSYVQLTADQIKCGDYVAVNVTFKYNGMTSPKTPGLYVNPNGIVLIGYGSEIQSGGGDPDVLFAGYTPQLPAGATATPTLGSAPLPQNMAQPQAAPQQYQQPAQPQAAAPQAAAPQAAAPLPPPAHDIIQNAGQQPAPMGNGHAPLAGAPTPPIGQNAAPIGGVNGATTYPSNPQPQAAAPLPQGMPGAPAGR